MNKDFWKAALIRALHTICQAALAIIGTASFISDVDWKLVASAALMAGIISILKSVVIGLPETYSPHEMTDEEAAAFIDENEELEEEMEEYEDPEEEEDEDE